MHRTPQAIGAQRLKRRVNMGGKAFGKQAYDSRSVLHLAHVYDIIIVSVHFPSSVQYYTGRQERGGVGPCRKLLATISFVQKVALVT